MTSRRELDEADIAAITLRGTWAVVRRGRPHQPLRLLHRTISAETAARQFARARAKMRQGMLAMVDPEGRIVEYASEPMVRTRW